MTLLLIFDKGYAILEQDNYYHKMKLVLFIHLISLTSEMQHRKKNSFANISCQVPILLKSLEVKTKFTSYRFNYLLLFHMALSKPYEII